MSYKYTHWLVIKNDEVDDWKELKRYKDNYDCTMEVYLVDSKNILINKYIKLECNQDYTNLDLQVNSLSSNIERLNKKPSNIFPYNRKIEEFFKIKLKENEDMKNRYIIKIWETENDRNQGTPFEMLNTPQTLEEAINEARKLFNKNKYASIEVQDRELENKTLFFQDSEVERYFGEAVVYKPFVLQDTAFYKYFRQEFEEVFDSYADKEEFNLDKLDENDLDKLTEKLFNDDYFNQFINEYLQDRLQERAAEKVEEIEEEGEER